MLFQRGDVRRLNSRSKRAFGPRLSRNRNGRRGRSRPRFLLGRLLALAVKVQTPPNQDSRRLAHSEAAQAFQLASSGNITSYRVSPTEALRFE